MPVSKPSELPNNGGGRWPHTGFRSTQWGDMEVGYTIAPAVDCAPGYVGLPGNLCHCPHYGYVFRGRLRATYPGTTWPDDIAETGDAYFFPAGHTLAYDEESECLEFNPAAALVSLMDHFELMLSGEWAVGGGSPTDGRD